MSAVTLDDVVTAVQTTLAAELSDTTHLFDAISDVNGNLPAIVVVPRTADFNVTMNKGTDTYELDLIVIVAEQQSSGEPALRRYVSGVGDMSVRSIIFATPDLGIVTVGGAPRVNAHVSGLENFGGMLAVVGEDHMAATLKMTVHVSGAS